jgi:hypothetical protein
MFKKHVMGTHPNFDDYEELKQEINKLSEEMDKKLTIEDLEVGLK